MPRSNPFRGCTQPQWPFRINRNSKQAEGLDCWIPGHGGMATLYNQSSSELGAVDLLSTEGGLCQLSFTAFHFLSQCLAAPSGLGLDGTSIRAGQLNFDLLKPFSMACWAAGNKDGSGTTWPTFTSPFGTPQSGFNFDYDLSVLPIFQVGGQSAHGIWGGHVLSFTPPADQMPHHFVGTYDGSNFAAGMQVFIDGVAVSTSVVADDNPGSLVVDDILGCTVRGDAFGGWGFLSDLRVYTRVLSATEIWQLYDPRTRWELYQ